MDIRQLVGEPGLVVCRCESADDCVCGAADGKHFGIAISCILIHRVIWQPDEPDGFRVIQCDHLWRQCGAALRVCGAAHRQNWMRAYGMGIGHGRPVSGSVGIACNSSAAHLDRRATRQYIWLYVGGPSSVECFQTV